MTEISTDLAPQLDLSGLAPLHPVLPHAVVYSKPQCPHCTRLKNKLHAAGIIAVGASLIEQPEARELFVGLGAAAAPVTLVHNVFDRPVYFAGALPDQINYLVAGFGERMAHLEAEGFATDSALRAGLEGCAVVHERSPSVSTEDFAALAAELIPPMGPQGKRVQEPARLRAERDQNPPVLLHAPQQVRQAI